MAEEPILDFDVTMKKKKKKKIVTPFDRDIVPIEENNVEELTEVLADDVNNVDSILNLDMDFANTKKKKKKRKELVELVSAQDNTNIENNENDTVEQDVWIDNERDYTHEELLERIFSIMREKNPDMVAGKKQKFIMRPPQVVRIGTKKTSFVNFTEICKTLHRQPKHLLDFLLAELGTSGSVDGNSQLIIKGRFQQKQIENVLRRYIKEYITCHTCKSPDTILQKDTRIFFLQCETCGSRCSVANIKSGFQAVTGKRAAIRARET
ncbi:hypothetical protein HCN44_000253 [Aphidius gifuensis]|uniref:Eukaryotic translation initiation factor 2 subunit 2 n=1 Tax=Aphidius gifuensis TaxID=684658 RepID=A0A834XN93_APHGI|nr:eukaryotic translation initiation factor 2 subunit 2-like [Aphidius gifuensis]KAF7990448.1 hypothetical protein HCN44_000253 [Aphidius gifuensis]